MSTLRLRLIANRDEYGPVSTADDFISVFGFSYQLVVRKNACTYMAINDFKKMVKVIKGVLDPDEYYEYLRAWETVIADKRFTYHASCEKENRSLRKDERIILERLAKLDKFLDKQISDLPEWAIYED